MKKLVTVFLVFLCSLNVYGQTWTAQNSGTTNQLRHVFFVDANTGWAVGYKTILKTTNGGTTWFSQSPQPAVSSIGCYFVSSSVGWIGGDDGVYKTTDGGNTWTLQPSPYGITKLFFLDGQTGWAVGGIDGSTPMQGDVFKTTDGGTTWSHVTDNSTWSRFYGVQFVDASYGWVYTEANGLLLKTTNGGGSWAAQMSYGKNVAITGMFFLNKDLGWVGGHSATSGVCYKTTDGGATWTDYANGASFAFSEIRFLNKDQGWAVGNGMTSRGIVNTTDGGITWKRYDLPSNIILNNLFMLDDKTGWAVGEGGVILKYSSSTSKVESNTAHVSTFTLEQNYPNPFNPSTTINYSIPKSGMVNLTVYNVLGNQVAVLVNDDQAAGEHSVKFNASNLSNGVYLYKLTSGNYSSTKKLVLMK